MCFLLSIKYAGSRNKLWKNFFLFPRVETASGMDSYVLKNRVGLSTWELIWANPTVLRPHPPPVNYFVLWKGTETGGEISHLKAWPLYKVSLMEKVVRAKTEAGAEWDTVRSQPCKKSLYHLFWYSSNWACSGVLDLSHHRRTIILYPEMRHLKKSYTQD